MQKKSNKYLLLFLSFIFLLFTTNCSDAQNLKVREAITAKMGWYPENPQELTKKVDQLLKQAPKTKITGTIIGLISPHAGYFYSGHVAASAYSLLNGKKINRVVVISPTHIRAFNGVSIYNGDAYATPLGNIPVDHGFADKLAKKSSLIKRSVWVNSTFLLVWPLLP